MNAPRPETPPLSALPGREHEDTENTTVSGAGRASEAPCPRTGLWPPRPCPLAHTEGQARHTAQWKWGPFAETDKASYDSLGFAPLEDFHFFSSSIVSVFRSPISNSFSPFPLFFSHPVSHGCPPGTLAKKGRPPRGGSRQGNGVPRSCREQPTAHAPRGLSFPREPEGFPSRNIRRT